MAAEDSLPCSQGPPLDCRRQVPFRPHTMSFKLYILSIPLFFMRSSIWVCIKLGLSTQRQFKFAVQSLLFTSRCGYNEVFNGRNMLFCTVFYRIILVYVNIIIITINCILVRHVSICICHFQVTVKRNEVFGCLLYLSGSC